MIKFIEKYFVVLVLIITVLTFFKSCGDSREIATIRKEYAQLKDSVCTKSELRSVKLEVNDMKTTLWGAMDSWSFIMDKFVDSSVKNRANKEAWSMLKQMDLQKKERK